MVPSNMYSSTSKFVLLAIPFFIFGGNIMAEGGISERLINFCRSLVGHKRSGMALVCVIVSCFFAAISGSGPATVAALGMIIIPAMVQAGYDKASGTALMSTAGAIGIIIPLFTVLSPVLLLDLCLHPVSYLESSWEYYW